MDVVLKQLFWLFTWACGCACGCVHEGRARSQKIFQKTQVGIFWKTFTNSRNFLLAENPILNSSTFTNPPGYTHMLDDYSEQILLVIPPPMNTN